eukprot:6055612-Pyramimonas_sp.AAC.1
MGPAANGDALTDVVGQVTGNGGGDQNPEFLLTGLTQELTPPAASPADVAAQTAAASPNEADEDVDADKDADIDNDVLCISVSGNCNSGGDLDGSPPMMSASEMSPPMTTDEMVESGQMVGGAHPPPPGVPPFPEGTGGTIMSFKELEGITEEHADGGDDDSDTDGQDSLGGQD